MGQEAPRLPVGKHREGSYVLIVAEGPGALVKEVERRIRVTDGIFKFMTVRVDEELRKAERARRSARSPRRSASRGRGAPAPARARRCSSELAGDERRIQGNRTSARQRRRRRGGGRGGAGAEDDKGKEGGKRYFFRRRKVCKFCADKIDYIDYKDVKTALAASCPSAARSCRGACSGPAPSTSAS